MSALAKTVLKDDGHVVRRVAIVGGTHGNERNGIFAARHLLKDTKRASRSTFETTVDLANPAAIAVVGEVNGGPGSLHEIAGDCRRLQEIAGDCGRRS